MRKSATRKIALLTAALMFLSQTIGFAASVNSNISEYDPRAMTFEERAAWVEANVEPIYSGQAVRTDARSEWLYTNLDTSYAGPDGYDVGKLETRVKFLCNPEYTEVVSWASDTFRASPIGPTIIDTDYNENRIYPNNVSVVYTAWYASMSGAYLIEHWYNLHGRGACDLRVVKG